MAVTLQYIAERPAPLDPDEEAAVARIVEQATESLIQVHGGIGFTFEHDAHLYWRRAKVDRLLLGSSSYHYRQVAELSLA